MKTAIVIAVAFCIALALAEVDKKCQSNDECGEGECCVKHSHFFLPAKCKKLREKGQVCFPNEDLNKSGNLYKFMCPCVDGMTCIAAETKEVDGATIYRDAKCVEK